jgi:hypothetical protein
MEFFIELFFICYGSYTFSLKLGFSADILYKHDFFENKNICHNYYFNLTKNVKIKFVRMKV